MSYFFLSPINLKKAAIACAPSDTPASYIIENDVIQRGMPFRLKLKNIIFNKKGSVESEDLSDLKHLWLDYQPNSLSWPIFSERMKNIISASLTGMENIEWIDVVIELNDSEARNYYLLKFISQKNILNMEKSIFSGSNSDFLAIPAFSKKEIQCLNIFCTPDEFPRITMDIYISNEIRLACTDIFGLSFEEITLY